MRPVLYEIRRSLFSRFSIVMIVVIIGLSALMSYEGGVLSTSGASRAGGVYQVSGYYESGGNLTVLSYFYDGNGNPVSVKVNATVNGTVYPSNIVSRGLYKFYIPYSLGLSAIHLKYTFRQFGVSTSAESVLNVDIQGLNYSGLDIVPGIISPKNSTQLGFILFYVGFAGNHTSPPIDVFIASANSSKGIAGIINNYSWKESFSGFNYEVVFPNLGSSAIGKDYVALARNSTPQEVPLIKVAVIGPLSVYRPFTPSSVESAFFSTEGTLLSIFIPLLAVFMAYFTYGKDRVTGVLESIIKRPITRGQAIRSRFFANSVVVAISILIAILLSDIISSRYFHLFMPASFVLYVSWAYIITGLSFVAISYMFSHILKSQGSLLGGLIGIFMVFALFWSVIFDVIVSVFSIPSGTSSYIWLHVAFNYASPAGYVQLVQLYLTNSLSAFGGLGGQSVNALSYGVTPAALFVSGIIWVLVPFVIAHELAVGRD